MRSILIPSIIILIALAVTHARAAEPNALCPHVDRFILEMDRIAMEADDARERRKLYDKAIRELVIEARRFFGIFCPCADILEAAHQYSIRVEWYRSPPPGWEPEPSAENLLFFNRMAKDIGRFERQLLDLCWTGTGVGG